MPDILTPESEFERQEQDIRSGTNIWFLFCSTPNVDHDDPEDPYDHHDCHVPQGTLAAQ